MNNQSVRMNNDVNQRTTGLPPSTQSLWDMTFSPENLDRAWKRVRANKGAPGIDGLTIEEFPAYMKKHGLEIMKTVRQGRYKPYPVRRAYIEKDDGSLRKLGIPTVFDRLIQQAIVQTLTPIIDPTFSESSFGYRPNRSQHQAVREIQKHLKEGFKIVVDVDLSKFFDRMNHDLMMTLLGRRISDKALLKLIASYLRAGIVEDGQLLDSHIGAPQGGPLSPILSNVMLDVLDKELEQRGHKFVRYADDFAIFVKSQAAGERVLASITKFTERTLKLLVNEQKSKVVQSHEFSYLGFMFQNKHLTWSSQALAKFKYEVKRLTGRSWGVSMGYRIHRLSLYLRGWINYFGIANRYQNCLDLDHWIRRRIRMCYWKQWVKPRTKVRALMRLGVDEYTAACCGISSKSFWHSSRSKGIHRGLNDKFLLNQGLYSLRTGWIKIHHG